jgi:hypothetical protein
MRANGRPVALYEYRGSGEPEPPWTGPKCGTYAGWNDHQRNHEPPCESCRAAHREYMREWRLRTGRVKSVRVRLTAAELALLRRS